jgi:type IV pilus assembly protein PilW
MVGMAVGLITVLVIVQTMSLFQGGRNTLTGGTSAQENGLFAMQLVAGDIRSTGAGYYSTSPTGAGSLQSCINVCSFYGSSGKGYCSNNGASGQTGNPIASISGQALTGAGYHLQAPLFPIIIETQPTGTGVTAAIPYAAGSDIVTVRSAARFLGSVPTTTAGADMSANVDISVGRTFGFKAGDLALIADGGSNCTVFEVTALSGLALSHSTSSSFNPSSGFNWPDATSGNLNGGKTFGNTAMVYNLGTNAATNSQNVTRPGVVIAREYSIAGPNSTTMQMRQMGAANPNVSGTAAAVMPMADGVVALKAQYGIAASATSATVTSWVGSDSGSTWTTTWAPGVLTQANAQLIRAIRLLVVARSGNRETTTVTGACTSGAKGPCPWPNTVTGDPVIDLTKVAVPSGADATTEWQHYRYKIYTTVVPIRNILWNGSWTGFQGP